MTELKRDGLPVWSYFLIGAGLGAVTALLFAPKSGTELRKDIAETAHKGVDCINTGVHQFKEGTTELYSSGLEKAAEVLEAGKELIHEKKEQVVAAFEAGKEAYQHKKVAGVSGD